MDIKELLENIDETLHGIWDIVKDSNYVPSDSEAASYLHGSLEKIGESISQLSDSIEEFKKENNISESKMEDTKLRKFIQEKVLEFLTEKKALAEAKKEEGPSKPTSGLDKLKVGTTHTAKNKGKKNPPAKKITAEAPDKTTFLTGAEPTPTGNETKEIKDGTEDALKRGKYPGETDTNYKTECMGVELNVKGNSYADINHLYLIGQIKKALEGRGDFVKKVTIELGEPDKIEESKDIKDLRKKIREIVINELGKKKSLNEAWHRMFKNGDIVSWIQKFQPGQGISSAKYTGKIIASERTKMGDKEFIYKILVTNTVPKTDSIGKEIFVYESQLQKGRK